MEPVLEVRNLNSYYTENRSIFGGKGKRKQVLKDVSFDIYEGEIVGLVGESGSGKTVTAMSISGLLPRGKADVSGSITLDGSEILQCPESELLDILGEELGIVFQEPMTSMNPVMKIGP